MKKQWKYFVLFAVLLLGTTKVFATTTYMINGVMFLPNEDDGTAFINGYTDELPAEVILNDRYSIEGTDYIISGINEHAFQNCTILRSIYLPDGISNIGEKAFAGCTNLSRILLAHCNAGEVPTVGDDSFAEVSAMLITRNNDVKAQISETWGGGSFTITLSGNTHVLWNYQDDGTLYIDGEGDMIIDGRISGSEAPWTGLKNVARTIIVGEGITNIGYRAFSEFTALTSIRIPQGVTSIDECAFDGCTNLVEIAIPSTVEYIGDGAFGRCEKLKDVIVETGSNLVSLGRGAFSRCKNLQSINLPDGMQIIGASAFDGCESLEGIEIPFGIKTIGADSFFYSGLTEISIPNSVISIGVQAFDYCTKLTRVDLPESLRAIGSTAFGGCSNLVDIEIPNSVETIGYQAFSNCSSLKKIELPNSLIEIGSRAFAYCTQLESLSIPVNVSNIGSGVIAGCLNLSSVTVADGNETYDSRDGCQAIIETATNTLIAGCAKTRVPETVTTIGTAAYINHSNITSLISPENITSISNSAFQSCSGLTSVTIPNSVTSIGDHAFAYCRSLNSLVFPSSVSNIGIQVFNNCKNLKYIDLSRCTELSEITVDRSNGIFKGVNESTLIYLPSGNGHSAGSEKNVVIGGICEKTSINDKTIFESPTEFSADDASYDRTFTSGVTATVCLPYTIAASNVTGGTFYSFSGVSSDYVVTMNEVTGDVLGNTPYLFVPTDASIVFNGSVTVNIVNSETETVTTNGNWAFCGTYETISWETNEDFGGDIVYGFAANDYGDNVVAGDFVRVEPSNNSYINPYRAYLRYTAPSGTPSIYPTRSNSASLPERLTVKLVNHDGSATVIGEMERTNESKGMWYTVDGQRLSGKPTMKGVYINHGHKVIVK